jgi:hypothetical protein
MTTMKQYKVTLNLTFEKVDPDLDESVNYEDYDEENEMDMEEKRKREAFDRTDAYFEENDVGDYVKEVDAFDFTEYTVHNGDVISAEWDKKKFAVHMIVDTTQSKEELIEDLRWNSLEDGEYEGCGNTGWIVMTRGPKGEEFGEDGKWDMEDFWVYGLTDYRKNKIEVVELAIKEEIPKEEELFTMTKKGQEIYRKMASLKEEGIQFSEEDELKFKVMKILMKDPRLYPVGRV